jgi:hypothetical protein
LGDFRNEIEAHLNKLKNPLLAAAFAIRAGLRVLPILASGVDEGKEFLWFWKKPDRTQHLLALLQAYNAAGFMIINPNASISNRLRMKVLITGQTGWKLVGRVKPLIWNI